MSWIILALTLGASITSIIHGVFMLFGSLSVSGGTVFGIPSTLLASLPVISAVFALIGGIIAFNQSKWGSIFLFIAMGLCVPARDTWLYGGLYFFAGLFCFFLKPKQQDNILYDSYEDGEPLDFDEESERNYYPENQDFYYGSDIPPRQAAFNENASPVMTQSVNPVNIDTLDDNMTVSEALQINTPPPKLRRRMSKSCPECGAIVSRDNKFCPTCGAQLSVSPNPDEDYGDSSSDDGISIQNASDQLLQPNMQEIGQVEPESDNISESALNPDANNADDTGAVQTAENYRILVKPRQNEQEANMRTGTGRRRSIDNSGFDAATSYQEFSKYTRRAKKRKRSVGRKVLSMLLLVSAVGGALYFLLGLRKLPPGDLPPIARTEVTTTTEEILPVNIPPVKTNTEETSTAEPVALVVAENVLPNFTPETNPRNGVITGSSVNVRSDHTTSSSRVDRLKVNTKVEIIGTFNVTSGQHQGIWYNIRTGGKEGWVYGRYVQPVGSGLPSGYSNALLKTFGSSKSQLVESLGNPTRNTSSSAEWQGLTATLKGEEITRIRLTNANRELQNGLKVGMSQTALLQIMGYPSSQNGRTMNYNENGKTGLSIQLDKNNSISSITVNEI